MMAAGPLSDAIGIREQGKCRRRRFFRGNECQMPPPIDSLLPLKAIESESMHLKWNTLQNVNIFMEKPNGV